MSLRRLEGGSTTGGGHIGAVTVMVAIAFVAALALALFGDVPGEPPVVPTSMPTATPTSSPIPTTGRATTGANRSNGTRAVDVTSNASVKAVRDKPRRAVS